METQYRGSQKATLRNFYFDRLGLLTPPITKNSFSEAEISSVVS